MTYTYQMTHTYQSMAMSMTYTYQILHRFDLKKKFLGWIIKFYEKGGPVGLATISLMSVEVLIDFIAMLLTQGISLKQIVNTNNTNMYLIHFYSKNDIQMCFQKMLGFKVSTQSQSFIIHHNVVK